MGNAASIENAQYDPSKFQQSRAIMESTADDAEKFAKLKAIWVDAQSGAPAPAKDAGASASASGDDHKKSVKELPPAEAHASSGDDHSKGPSVSDTGAHKPAPATQTPAEKKEVGPKTEEHHDSKQHSDHGDTGHAKGHEHHCEKGQHEHHHHDRAHQHHHENHEKHEHHEHTTGEKKADHAHHADHAEKHKDAPAAAPAAAATHASNAHEHDMHAAAAAAAPAAKKEEHADGRKTPAASDHAKADDKHHA
ncbi:hypothetical protein PINS_up006452 [Pythium insidiosum]|nr:hypothetical protein PINS_up006452 [Pythium insidiosum]